jgi:hypothetical protein
MQEQPAERGFVFEMARGCGLSIRQRAEEMKEVGRLPAREATVPFKNCQRCSLVQYKIKFLRSDGEGCRRRR